MSTNAMSGHGTLIGFETGTEGGGGVPTPGTARFTNVAEFGDITPPGLTRNEFDAATQENDIDSYALGILRRSAFQGKINFIPTNGTHNEATGLMYLMKNKTMIGWRYLIAGGMTVIASGQVREFQPHSPVDGLQTADVTIRFSGPMIVNGVVFGS